MPRTAENVMKEVFWKMTAGTKNLEKFLASMTEKFQRVIEEWVLQERERCAALVDVVARSA